MYVFVDVCVYGCMYVYLRASICEFIDVMCLWCNVCVFMMMCVVWCMCVCIVLVDIGGWYDEGMWAGVHIC